jgi:hypothetical protein
VYVYRNMQARSRNHCCCGKAISITYSECVSVAIFIQHAMLMRRIVICGLPGSTIFFPHFLTHGTIFEKKKVIKYKICLVFSTSSV